MAVLTKKRMLEILEDFSDDDCIYFHNDDDSRKNDHVMDLISIKCLTQSIGKSLWVYLKNRESFKEYKLNED